MTGHIAGGVSTSYYADEHMLDKSFTVQELFARLRNSMAAAAVISNWLRSCGKVLL